MAVSLDLKKFYLPQNFQKKEFVRTSTVNKQSIALQKTISKCSSKMIQSTQKTCTVVKEADSNLRPLSHSQLDSFRCSSPPENQQDSRNPSTPYWISECQHTRILARDGDVEYISNFTCRIHV